MFGLVYMFSDRSVVWAQERTPIANLIRWKDKPVALSIVQGRVVGLAHFTVGYILTYEALLLYCYYKLRSIANGDRRYSHSVKIETGTSDE
jgi:hypothetical protein